jgi:peptidoglycan/xylan/chitin deacetylase (PgdA/CDA1 family)
MSATALPVLMYHHVSPNPGLVTVSPHTFHAHMAWLARHGYRTVGCDDLASFLAGSPLPPKSVLVTFDDGYLDNYVYAHPVLREYGLHAAIFLVTGWIGDGPVRPHHGGNGATPECPDHRQCMEFVVSGECDRAMLRWSEIEAMRAAGTFEFHSHTHTHTRWDKRIAAPPARMEALADDLEKSRTALSTNLGAASAHLCWPQGYHDADYQRVAWDAGFRYLYTVRKGVNRPHSPAEAISRTVVKDKVGPWFATRLWVYRHAAIGGLYARLRGD